MNDSIVAKVACPQCFSTQVVLWIHCGEPKFVRGQCVCGWDSGPQHEIEAVGFRDRATIPEGFNPSIIQTQSERAYERFESEDHVEAVGSDY